MAGIFISKGMTVTIPAGGLKISLGPDGPSVPSVTVHVHFDVCPTWCELAMTHLASANSHEAARVLAWQGTDENEKAKSLEREFESSMQAVKAAAIAIDAFFAVVRGHVQIPPGLVDKWRVRRTASYSQVTEVLRRGFHLKPKGTKALRDNLKEIYRFRDMAVHPSGRIQALLLHPDLDVCLEWRFVYFRAANARALVNAATGIVWQSNRNVILRAGVGSFAITGGNLDVVQTNASGKSVVDTKAERLKLQTDDLDDLSAKAQADAVLGTMLESFSTALNEPDSEFVRLYQIRDALVKRFGSERDAKEALGISTSDWKFFGQMANDEPVVGGRHRGKSLGPLRNATTDERARMRALAEDWIRKFAATL